MLVRPSDAMPSFLLNIAKPAPLRLKKTNTNPQKAAGRVFWLKCIASRCMDLSRYRETGVACMVSGKWSYKFEASVAVCGAVDLPQHLLNGSWLKSQKRKRPGSISVFVWVSRHTHALIKQLVHHSLLSSPALVKVV